MSAYASRVYRLIFAAAAAYNIAFGLWASLAPNAFFATFHLAPPRYPSIWACLGMVIGLYGVGYAYASARLDRAFPFIAIGLAGKILGPIGWPISELPARTFALIAFDDLMWWLPFALFLAEGTRVTRSLARNAPYWCAALHTIAGIGALTLLRGGSEAVADVNERVAYLNAYTDRWRAGWILWMLAALSLNAFYAWWGSHLESRAALIAFAIGALGLFCDFAGESIFIGWVPDPRSSLYRTASLLSAGAGNALYTIAGIVLTTITPRIRFHALAWAAWTSGIALTIATIANAAMAITIASAALMLTFIPFTILLGRTLR